jgi:hypothetical protein
MAFELLESLSSRQIQELYGDIHYIAEGYKVMLVVDTFDICEYCFPLGIEMDEKIRKSISQMGDEQFAYDFLFNRPIWGKPLLINEYKIELFNTRNKILRMSEALLNKKNNLEEQFIRPILQDKDPENRKTKMMELQNTLSFLISYALFSEESVKRFSGLIGHNFITDAAEITDDTVAELFAANHPDLLSLVKSTFEEWIEIRKPALRNIKDKMDLVNELNAAYRDIAALIKILGANRKLQKAEGKYIILLHSSTKERTDSILKLNTITELQASVGIPDYSFIRNKSQTFLLSLLWEQGSQDKEERLQRLALRLNELIKVATDYETRQSINDSYSKKVKPVDFIRTSDQIIDAARFAFEKNYLLERMGDYETYKRKILELVKKLEGEDKDQYGDIIDLYNDFLGQSKMKVFNNNSELAFENVKLIYSLQLNISTIVKGILQTKKIRVSKGNDMIRGSFHHLPILMFLHENNFDRNAKKIMDPLLDFCLKPESVRIFQAEDFMRILRGFTDFETRFRETPTISLLSLFLTLLLPVLDEKKQLEGKGPRGDTPSNEENALMNAENLYPIYERFTDILDKSSINYFKELRYIMVWLYRRCQRYEESLAMADACIRDYPGDPRFYHGKCLALYSRYLTNEQKEFRDVDQVNEVIALAEKSILLYAKDKDANNKVSYTMAALNNTLAHLYSVKYNFGEKDDDLRLARKNFGELQSFLNGIDALDYRQYPELLHTEASLELSEARAFRKAGDWAEATIRLDAAADSIQMALHIVPDYLLYLNMETDIRNVSREIKKIMIKEEKRSSKN